MTFKKNFIFFFLGILFSRTINIFLVPLYIGYISKSDFGILEIINQIISLIILISCLEISQGLARYYYEINNDERKIYLSSAFFFSLLTQTFLFTLIWFNRYEISKYIFGKTVYYYQVQLLSIIAFFATFNALFNSLFVVSKQARSQAFNSILYAFVSGLTTVYFVIFKKEGLNGILYGSLIAYLVGSLYGIHQFKNSILPICSFRHIKEMLSFSIPLVFSSASIFILTYFDRFMISSMLDTSSLGIYSLGFKLSLIGSIVFSVFKLITTPFIFENYKSQHFQAHLKIIIKAFTLLSIFTLIFGDLFSNDLILLFADERFLEASSLIKYFIVSSACFTALIFFPGMSLAKKTIPAAFVIVSAAILNICLNYLLIPISGIYGAALATFFANFILIVFYYFFSIRYFDQQVRYLIPSLVFILIYLFVSEFIIQSFPIFNQLAYKGMLFLFLTISSFFVVDPKKDLIKFLNQKI